MNVKLACGLGFVACVGCSGGSPGDQGPKAVPLARIVRQEQDRDREHAQQVAQRAAFQNNGPTGIVLGASYQDDHQEAGTAPTRFVFNDSTVTISGRLIDGGPTSNGILASKTWVFETSGGLRAISGIVQPEMKTRAICDITNKDLARMLLDRFHMDSQMLNSPQASFKLSDLDAAAKYHPGDWVELARMPYRGTPGGKPGEITIDPSSCTPGTLCNDLYVLDPRDNDSSGQVSPDGSTIHYEKFQLKKL